LPSAKRPCLVCLLTVSASSLLTSFAIKSNPQI